MVLSDEEHLWLAQIIILWTRLGLDLQVSIIVRHCFFEDLLKSFPILRFSFYDWEVFS